MHETFLEFPPEALPRVRFRQLIRHLQSHPESKRYFKGNEGRKLWFVFESKEKAESFLEAVRQMFERQSVETQKTEVL